MFCAHINPTTKKEQSVMEHLYSVSKMSMEYGAKISLGATAELIGLLHDMGKLTKEFDSYIRYSTMNPSDKSLKGKIDHSTAGAKFIYDNFYNSKDPYQKLTAQLISLGICSHHGGLIDCLDLDVTDRFTNRMKKDKEFFYDEALSNFNSECLDMTHINSLIDKSENEIKNILLKINSIDKNIKFGQFATGMIQKYLFSCVIDADRYDTYTFMENKDQQQNIDKTVLWSELAEVLEAKLKNYPKQSKIDMLREEISISCRDFGKNKPGIYQLSVPTGGGKTLSSLRYALEHAKKFSKEKFTEVKEEHMINAAFLYKNSVIDLDVIETFVMFFNTLLMKKIQRKFQINAQRKKYRQLSKETQQNLMKLGIDGLHYPETHKEFFDTLRLWVCLGLSEGYKINYVEKIAKSAKLQNNIIHVGGGSYHNKVDNLWDMRGSYFWHRVLEMCGDEELQEHYQSLFGHYSSKNILERNPIIAAMFSDEFFEVTERIIHKH